MTTEVVDMITVVVDGFEVSVPKGTLVIRAAEQLGIQIPRFCDHPLLEPVGACRQCLVDIEINGRAFPKPQASCTIPVEPGMIVKTQLTSTVAEKAQRGVMELLLVNHPLDCPVCDKGGECPLQDQAFSHGPGESRYIEEKRHYEKPIPISDIKHIQSLCKEYDDDLRWLIALLSDTGMRLSEGAGLLKSDINLDCEIPHINLIPHPWRRLKTKGSQRCIPLV